MDLAQRECNMKVALVCIAKNEDNYIKEWYDYHMKIGFDDIIVYQNDWECNITEPNLIKYRVDGKNKQLFCYNNFITEHQGKYDWVAFFDVDEFLVLKKHKNVKEFIKDYEDYPGIGINWVFFGDNNHNGVIDDYSVISRFIKREKKVNNHVKSIVKLTPELRMLVHNPSNTVIVDTNKCAFKSSFSPKQYDDIAQLNHYFTKTKEEFIKKVERGRADAEFKRNYNEFNVHNINEVDDFTAHNFYFNEE